MNVLQHHFVAERACEAYVASVTRPDLSFGFSAFFQYCTTTVNSVQLLNETIKLAKEQPSRCLKFVNLNHVPYYLAVYSDASFAGSSDLSPQTGFVICFLDKI